MTRAIVIIALLLSHAASADWRNEAFAIAVNMGRTQNSGAVDETFAWAMDAKFANPRETARWEFDLDSDYREGFEGDARYDRFKTWGRYLWQQQGKWYPLAVLSMEGDHSLRRADMIFAGGYRYLLEGGYAEVTVGAAKDLCTGDVWVGDLGLQLNYRRDWGRFAWTVTPEGQLDILGEAHLRPDEFRYAVDTGLHYRLTPNVAVTYGVQMHNDGGASYSRQIMGLTFRR